MRWEGPFRGPRGRDRPCASGNGGGREHGQGFVNCAPDSLSPGTAATCVATVTDTGSAETRQPPSGTVTYTLENGSTGTFDPDASCDLEPSGAFSSKCTVSYTPTTINGGEHDLLATYGGDPAHGRATTRLALEVTPVNDETDNATRISLPAKLTGTTEGATWGDDPELCGDAWAPVGMRSSLPRRGASRSV